MVDEKAVELVLRLHKNTENKKLMWEPTVERGVFEISFPQHSVQISQEEGDYVISIHNFQGISVERFSDADLINHFASRAPSNGWYEFMAEIYEMARRQALKADEAIDSILGELD